MSPFTKRKPTMYDFCLSEDFLMNFWLRSLPIKSTVRFRCVSRSWCASLSDPQFIYKKLTLPDAGNQDENDLLMVLDLKGKYYSVVSHEPLLATPLQPSPLLNVPAADEHRREVLTFCCDDLVCFHNECGEGIGLWNLTTGETNILPSLHKFLYKAIGFGFDDKIKDYKIVHIGFYNGGCEVYVYSLRTGNNVWRKLEEPNVPPFISIGVPSDTYCRSYRDGVFYWCDSKDKILSFDTCSEVFNTISIPQQPYPPGDEGFFQWERIWKLKDDGSMLLISRTGVEDVHVHDLWWAFLDVGVSSSLTKLFNIDWHYEKKQLLPMGFWRNELVFDLAGKRPRPRLIMGDPSEEPCSSKEVEIDGPLGVVSCSVWTKRKNSVALN